MKGTGKDVIKMKDGRFEASDIYNLLNAKFSDSRQWIVAREVSDTTGGGNRRLDFVAANCYWSKDYGVHAFEVKISKSDFRHELTDPTKHNIFFDDIDTYSIVAPEYVLDSEYRSLVPKNWGIYVACLQNCSSENAESGNPENKSDEVAVLKTVRKPLALHDEKNRKIDRGFVMSMLRAMSRQDAKCHPVDEIQKARQEGMEAGIEYGSRTSGDYKRRYEELQYARNACRSLGVHSESDFKRMQPHLEAIRTVVEERMWLNHNIDNVMKAANELRSAFEKLYEGIDKQESDIENKQQY